MKHSYNYNTVFREITIVTEDDFLIEIIFGKEKIGLVEEPPLIKKIKKADRWIFCW
ncbi:MAG: hypothetical protein PHT75_01225 [Bacilli bacterium]|nr:hypothetical protein [Bacilli bacterium]MDD3304737.1 hypothetical protein [Bacilli bacterium]MDD4053584.1 hypothetical protein [Bacilli bacterium]MDD4411083.1 hypothetical protein [Bacilli bacterium]